MVRILGGPTKTVELPIKKPAADGEDEITVVKLLLTIMNWSLHTPPSTSSKPATAAARVMATLTIYVTAPARLGTR